MPNLNRRCLTILLAAACVAPAAQAQTYPTRSIRLVVPWPAGGGADAVGRAVAQALTTELGKTVYVENVAGAGGNIGTQQFIRSAPDGYTLLLATSSTNVANPYLYKKTGFDPVKDFTPVASVALIPSVLVVPECIDVQVAAGHHRRGQGQRRASCRTARVAWARPRTWPASCSSRWPRSTSRMCRTRAAAQP